MSISINGISRNCSQKWWKPAEEPVSVSGLPHLTARLIGNHRKAGGKGIATKGGLGNGGIKPSDLGHSNLGLPSGNLT